MRLEGKVIPAVRQDFSVDVIAPVAPVPVALTDVQKTIVLEFPKTGSKQIALHLRIDLGHEGAVTAEPVLGVETVPAHGSEHLEREFYHTVAGRHRRIDHPVRLLPVHKLKDPLSGKQLSGR